MQGNRKDGTPICASSFSICSPPAVMRLRRGADAGGCERLRAMGSGADHRMVGAGRQCGDAASGGQPQPQYAAGAAGQHVCQALLCVHGTARPVRADLFDGRRRCAFPARGRRKRPGDPVRPFRQRSQIYLLEDRLPCTVPLPAVRSRDRILTIKKFRPSPDGGGRGFYASWTHCRAMRRKAERSCAPSSCSTAAIWPESDCCVICRASAARVKLRSRVRTEKYSIVCRFMVFSLSQVLPVSYTRIYSFTM